MKPDGSNMEPAEGAADAEQSQENLEGQTGPGSEQAESDAEPGVSGANVKSEAEVKVKPQGVASKVRHTNASLLRAARVPSTTNPSGKTTTSRKLAVAPTATRPRTKPLVATEAKRSFPSVKNQEKKPTTSTKHATTNGAAKPRTDSRHQAPAGRLTSAKAATARVDSGSIPKTSRPASTQSSGPSSRPGATTVARTAVVRASTAPPSCRSAAAQPPRDARKDVRQAPAAKRPAAAPRTALNKKPELSKPAATNNSTSLPKPSSKGSSHAAAQTKPLQPPRPAPAKKTEAPSWPRPAAKPLLRQTPPTSPANKPVKQGRPGSKPTQAVLPYMAVKKSKDAKASATRPRPADATAHRDDPSEPTVILPLNPPESVVAEENQPSETTAPEDASVLVTPLIEPVPEQTVTPSPVRATPPPAPPEEPFYLLTNQPPSSSPPLVPQAPLVPQDDDDDDDDEEREGSQLVSVSEMSGTTQPTEESRPGSAGPTGASAWRAPGALLSELDSEDVSGSQQGASELSAPGVLEGTESTDDLGDGSLKGAMDMEGASAGSDFEKFPDIPVNDFDEDDDPVCDMDVGSERIDEPHRVRRDSDPDEDEDVDMASEGVTESGLESYGNPDEDDFAEDERLDNLNRLAPPPPPELPTAQWEQPKPFDPWSEPRHPDSLSGAAGSLAEPWQDSAPSGAQAGPSAAADGGEYVDQNVSAPTLAPPPASQHAMSVSSTLSSEGSSPEEPADLSQKIPEAEVQQLPESTSPKDPELKDEEGPAADAASRPSSSSSGTEDEASDTEGEAQLEDGFEADAAATDQIKHSTRRCLSTLDEGDEAGVVDDTTPPSATSLASSGFDATTTASTSNAQSTGESCVKSPGIFSLEELPEEVKELGVVPPPAAQQVQREEQEVAAEENVLGSDENPDDGQPLYYSVNCRQSENSFPGFTSLPYRRDLCRTSLDPGSPRLPCADLRPPRSAGRGTLSPQLRRLEQHQLQLQEMQHRREQQQRRPLEEAELERKRREEEELRRKKEEAEEEIKRNEEELRRSEDEEVRRRKYRAEEAVRRSEEEEEQVRRSKEEEEQVRRELEQQLLQWQLELQPSKAPTLSPSSGLSTIYEALEGGDDDAEGRRRKEQSAGQDDPSTLEMSWGRKVDIVQQLIQQTLLLSGDGCSSSSTSSSLLLLPGGGRLSPLESSLWPALLTPLTPLTPPSATVTSVSSFSPEAASQGEWTVVELETHH